MAIKISRSTIIDDSRNIVNAGVITASSFVGSGVNLTGIPTSVNGATGTVVLDADDISDDFTTHKFATAAQLAKADDAASIQGSINQFADVSISGTPSNGDILQYTSGNFIATTFDIVDDTTPQLGGNLDLNGNDITGTGDINITGVITATTFSGNLPTTDLTGTITNAQLAGSIANGKLVNSTVSYGGIQLSLGGSDSTPAFDLSDATNYPYNSLTGITTSIVGDTSPQLGGNLDLNSNNITGTGDINITGSGTFSGNVSIVGTLTYEDVTNVDSVGLITARSGIDALGETTITASSTSALLIKDNSGDSTGLKLYSDSVGLSHINAGYGELAIETSGSEKVRVSAGGSVGIGADPDVILQTRQVSANSSVIGASLINDSTTAGAGVILDLTPSGAGAPGIRAAQIEAVNENGYNAISLALKSSNGTLPQTRLYIAVDGKIGIGTTYPTAKLDVVGNTKLKGDLIVGDNEDISPDANGSGQFQIDANGYTPYIAADGTALYVGHNSSSRDLRLQTNETDRLTIDGSTGSIGINTNIPLTTLDVLFGTSSGNRHFFTKNSEGVRLQRRGDSDGWAMDYGFVSNNGTDIGGFGALGDNSGLTRYYIGSSYTDTKFTLDSSGNLGLGLNNPDGLLHLKDAVDETKSFLVLQNRTAGSSVGVSIDFLSGNNDLSDDRYASIKSNLEGGNGHNISFHPNNSGSSQLEAMRITSTGSIGIGVTLPNEEFELAGNAQHRISIRATDTTMSDGGDYGGFCFYTNDSANPNRKNWDIYQEASGSTGTTHLVIDSFSTSDILRIQTDGDVGIKTDNPIRTLDVYGTMGVSDDVFLVDEKVIRWGTSDSATITGKSRGGDVAYLALAANSEFMRGDSTGSVGINDTSPSIRGRFVVRNSDGRYFAVDSSGKAIARYSDNGFHYTLYSQNYGMTAINHGAGLSFNLGAAFLDSATGGAILCQAESVWGSDASTKNSKIVIQTTASANNRIHATFHSNGKFTFGPGFAAQSDGSVIGDSGTSETDGLLYIKSGTAPYNIAVFQKVQQNFGTTDGALRIAKNSSNSRSINATGTLNASGTDYAEYMTKCGDFIIQKGDICGINTEGLLTNVYDDSIAFVVKSTNPSYVGGDDWETEPRPKDENGNEITKNEIRTLKSDAVGITTIKSDSVGVATTALTDDDYYTYYTDDQYDVTYETPAELSAWYERHESRRSLVDRIAYSGQVPVNGISSSTPGQYIVPSRNSDGSIGGISKNENDLTFGEYKKAIGKVIKIQDDGRPYIIVKVS